MVRGRRGGLKRGKGEREGRIRKWMSRGNKSQ
jgi:hypothetical protein